ncbi:MAG TPA: hypothetical protein VM735_07915 [Candidatus Kapabacteria bacterium]|nr:hypothetical protein [Candidatus Kapabacteria bacterium]
MVRPKEEVNKSVEMKQASFAFRRIQARELYQPANEADGNGRVRFRVRVQVLGRDAQ